MYRGQCILRMASPGCTAPRLTQNGPQCHKSFQRSDVLRRHKKIHQRAEEEGKQPRRALKACQACSSSKLKCDGQQPCSRCQSANASCVYEGPSAPKRLRVQTPLEASS